MRTDTFDTLNEAQAGRRVRRCRSLYLLCAVALVVVGCGAGRETPQGADVALGPLPRSMKGYELYSWRAGGEWYFTLITGTNRPKTHEEIVGSETAITEDDWVKVSVQGRDGLKAMLERLPAGETVTWNSGRSLEGSAATGGTIQFPDPQVILEIQSFCRGLGIVLQVAE